MANAPQPNGPSQQSGANASSRGVLRVGDYELKDVIGDRGTGTVYCARHVPSDKQVALKILHSRRQDVVDGLVRGAKAVSRVHHANLVDITDVGATRDGTVFLAMELLSGESLQDRLHRVGPLPLFEAINIVRQVAHGLGAAHAEDVIHGGLEPAKIFLCRRDGRRRIVRRNKATDMKLVVEPEGKFDLVKILDLGLKRFLDLASYQSDVRETARYWSPEQAQRRPIDVRSDIYSLGAVFYEMITGTVPFDGASLAEVLRQHVSGTVTAPSQRTPGIAIDALVDTVILRCLQKTPTLRFASTNELCDALDACVTDCAFLRDAHRLPGIETSGIDLPEVRSKSPAIPSPRPATPLPSVAKPAATSAARPVEPARTPRSARVAVEKPLARTTPPSPRPEASASTRVAPPPMPLTAARKTLPGVAPAAPVKHVAPPPLTKSVAAPELIPTVEQSELIEIPTPPVALSSDLLTDLADAPAPAETATAPANAAPAEVSNEAIGHVDSEAPAAPMDAPASVPDPSKAVQPAVADAAPAMPQSVDPAAPPPAPTDVPAAVVENTGSFQPEPPDSADSEKKAPAEEVVRPVESLPISRPSNRGDRVDDEDDDEDDLLASTLETWRRPKVMAVAAVALLGGIGFAVWASRGKSPSPGKPAIVAGTTSQSMAKPSPLPPPPAVAPPTPTPVPETPPLHAVAAETTAPAQVPAPTAPAAVLAEAKSPDKPAASAAAAVVVPPAPSAKTARLFGDAPARAVAVSADEPKPASPRPRPTPSTAREPAQAGRDLATTTEAPVAPKRTPAAPMNLPPRLAGAWPTAGRTAPKPASPAPKPAVKAVEQPKANGGKVAPPPASASADQLVREAQQAWLAGQHALALNRAQAALAASPKPGQAVQAYEIVATCSCILHRRDRALEAASHLDTTRRESVKAACAKNGVPFE
jgi:serine/threonine protein kinase